jgi:hypothetical protein
MTELGDVLGIDDPDPEAGNSGRPEQDCAHVHHWTVRKIQPASPPPMVFGRLSKYTLVLGQCTACGAPGTWLLPGEWTLADITGQAADISGQPADAGGQPS